MTRPATIDNTLAPDTGCKFLIHGSPGSGKTPLAASFLDAAPLWPSFRGDKAVFVACDRKEQHLAGIPAKYRSRMIRPDYAGAKDPYSFIIDVLKYDWAAEEASTIIIDTGTNLARDYLAAAVNSGSYNAKAVTFGSETFKLADKPHYGLAHTLMAKTVNAIKNCPLNVLALFWSDYQEPQDGYGAWGGPLTINMNFSKDVAGEFSNIIYTRTATESGRTAYYAHTESFGIWVARLHGAIPNPCPVMKMEPDPVHVWKSIHAAQEGQ